jgi:DNA replication protein DnaC
MFTQSRLGEHFQNISFNDYKIVPENEKIFYKVKEYSENFNSSENRSIILSGHVGRGVLY